MNSMNDEFNWTPDELQAIVDEHALVLFMKGNLVRRNVVFQPCGTSAASLW